MMPAYYNEIDAYCAQWLRNLIAAGLIPPGDVDERDIAEVAADDLAPYGQCHFFAGLGGWATAGRLARIPDDEPVWTGSCPCQPLSSAGRRQGHADERHLWPAFHRLIAERRPATVFGEQVAGKLGREWLAGVRADLEQLGYAVGAADLPAAGVGAPQIRQRLWWVGVANGTGPQPRGQAAAALGHGHSTEPTGGAGGLADAGPERRGARQRHICEPPGQPVAGRGGAAGGLGDAEGAGLAQRECDSRDDREDLGTPSRQGFEQAGGAGFWTAFDLIPCADGKARRVEPGTFPLAARLPLGVGKLRTRRRRVAAMAGLDAGSLRLAKSHRIGTLCAYGNAIVPQAAAAFIRAVMEMTA